MYQLTVHYCSLVRAIARVAGGTIPPTMVRVALLAVICTLPVAPTATDSPREVLLPSQGSVFAAGRRALAAYTSTNGPLAEASCAWTDSTLLIGAITFAKVSKDAKALEDAEAWGRKHGYMICGQPKQEFATTASATNGTGDDSCRVAVPDVAYSGSSSGKTLPAASFGDCCEHCAAVGYPKCSYFTWYSTRKQCSLQTVSTVAQRSPGALSGWPSGGPCPPQCRHVSGGVRGPHGANSQLCGASYIELSALSHNATLAVNTMQVLEQEVKNPSSVSDWSWVDALFMSMNTYSRLAATLGAIGTPSTDAQARQLFEKQWANFYQAALAPANGLTAYGFWNSSAGLFYRDSRFYGTEIFWGRGNAWAIGALVAAIRHGNGTASFGARMKETAGGQGYGSGFASDPHWNEYVTIFRQHAAKLRSIIGKDGAWRPSLLNPTAYPLGETTSTAGILYGLAFGLNLNLLTPRTRYLAAVAKAWKFLETTALQSKQALGSIGPTLSQARCCTVAIACL